MHLRSISIVSDLLFYFFVDKIDRENTRIRSKQTLRRRRPLICQLSPSLPPIVVAAVSRIK